MVAPADCIIYHGPHTAADEASSARWRAAEELFANGAPAEPALLVVDASMLARRDLLRRIPRRVVLVAADDETEASLGRRAPISIAGVTDHLARRRVLDAACMLSCARHAGVRIRRRLANRKLESREMSRIGMALMQERDLPTLLRQIVDQGKRLTESDGGGMLLAETDEKGVTVLRATLARLDYRPEFGRRRVVVAIDDTSIIGHAARIGEPVSVADAFNLPPGVGFKADQRFERDFGYHRKSMLAVPMLDHLGRLVGVVAFVNRKSDPTVRIATKEDADRYVLPYTDREVRLARSLASQAALAIENARLYMQIEQILESVVKASVTAIDERDATSAGHSIRVSALTTGLASAVERSGRGRYRETRFTEKQMRELRFAALLHDVGKITVQEDVLVKAKKLPPSLWERVDARFAIIRLTMEREHYRQRASLRLSHADERLVGERLERELTSRLEELDHMHALVRDANEPEAETDPAAAVLSDIASRTFPRRDGVAAPYLTPEELHFLRIPHGTLDAAERVEIESHAEQTYRFLVNIPWTADLGNLVDFAFSHHEKLDGSGYPRHLKADEIPVQVRMITIADIFDALTESDRPYKRAMPPDKALDILRAEATAGRIDTDLVEILIESQAYRRILEQDWRRL